MLSALGKAAPDDGDDPLDGRSVFDTCVYINLHMCMLPKLGRAPQRCLLPVSALGASSPSLPSGSRTPTPLP